MLRGLDLSGQKLRWKFAARVLVSCFRVMSSFTEKMESLKNVKILMEKQSQSSSPSPASSIVPPIDENVIDNDEQIVGGTRSWVKPLDSALAVQPSSSSSSSNSSTSSSKHLNFARSFYKLIIQQ